jgi:hypothetical protein
MIRECVHVFDDAGRNRERERERERESKRGKSKKIDQA